MQSVILRVELGLLDVINFLTPEHDFFSPYKRRSRTRLFEKRRPKNFWDLLRSKLQPRRKSQKSFLRSFFLKKRPLDRFSDFIKTHHALEETVKKSGSTKAVGAMPITRINDIFQ
jgi:hypothetical protein